MPKWTHQINTWSSLKANFTFVLGATGRTTAYAVSPFEATCPFALVRPSALGLDAESTAFSLIGEIDNGKCVVILIDCFPHPTMTLTWRQVMIVKAGLSMHTSTSHCSIPPFLYPLPIVCIPRGPRITANHLESVVPAAAVLALVVWSRAKVTIKLLFSRLDSPDTMAMGLALLPATAKRATIVKVKSSAPCRHASLLFVCFTLNHFTSLQFSFFLLVVVKFGYLWVLVEFRIILWNNYILSLSLLDQQV